MNTLHKPVFLLGSHKSGTSLLRSLLDSTPGFFTIPVETHFFQFTGFWVDYLFRRSLPETLAFEQILNKMLDHIALSNKSRSKTSDSSLFGRWDVDRFVSMMREKGGEAFEQQGFQGLMTVYVQAIHWSLYQKEMADERIVEKSVEHAEYAVLLEKFYPEAKFIHIVRNPYATLAAIRRYTAVKGYPFLGRHIGVLKNSFYYLYKNPLCIKNYKIIRYEDLVQETRKTMADIAAFLGTDFCSSMLVPSSMGTFWAGNSTRSEAFDGISTAPLHAWKDDISPMEIELVNRLFSHVCDDFDYAQVKRAGCVFRRAAKESAKIYLANRFLVQLADKWL